MDFLLQCHCSIHVTERFLLQVFLLAWAWGNPACSSEYVSVHSGLQISLVSYRILRTPTGLCCSSGFAKCVFRLRGGEGTQKRSSKETFSENPGDTKKARAGIGGWSGVKTPEGPKASKKDGGNNHDSRSSSFSNPYEGDGDHDDDDDDDEDDSGGGGGGVPRERTGADDTDSYVTRYSMKIDVCNTQT
jgi:hypothetical protein